MIQKQKLELIRVSLLLLFHQKEQPARLVLIGQKLMKIRTWQQKFVSNFFT